MEDFGDQQQPTAYLPAAGYRAVSQRVVQVAMSIRD